MSTQDESTMLISDEAKLALLQSNAKKASERLAEFEETLATEAAQVQTKDHSADAAAGIEALGGLPRPRPLPPETEDEPQWVKDKRFQLRAMAALNRRPDPFAADAIATPVPAATAKPKTTTAKKVATPEGRIDANEAIAALGGFRQKLKDGNGQFVDRAVATPKRFVNDF
jgi:hypothetical protein